MDRRTRLIATLAGAALLAGCGASHTRYGTGKPLAAGATPSVPSTGLRNGAVLSKGGLTYAVALADRDRVAVAVELELAFSLAVYDLRGDKPALRFRRRLGVATYDIYDLAVDDNARQAWVASADGTVRGFSLRDGSLLATLHMGAPATAVALSPDASLLATGSQTGVLCLRRRKDLALLQCTTAHRQRISSLAFAPTTRALASAAWDGSVKSWHVPNLRLRATKRLRGSANAVDYHPRADTIIVGTSSKPPVRTPEIAAQEQRAGVAYDNGARVVLWNVKTGAVRSCPGHRAPVTSVAFGPLGARFASAAWDRSVRLSDTATCAGVAWVGGFGQLVRDVAMGRAGRKLAVGAWSADLASNSTMVFDLLYP